MSVVRVIEDMDDPKSVVLEITEESDEHEGHPTCLGERIVDNPVEYTQWRLCMDCEVAFKSPSVTIVSAPWM